MLARTHRQWFYHLLPRTDPSLRDHILSALETVPSAEPLSLTVLSSTPRRTGSLFPYSAHVPRCLEREYFVTLGSRLESGSDDGVSNSTANPVVPPPLATEKPSRPEVLISALHAYLYEIPSSSTSILYISKVDTSGYAPPTARSSTHTLVTAFIEHFLLPTSRPSRIVQVCLFARSQGQYLFPNSVRSGGKRVAGGLKLCQWWKGVFEAVTTRVAAAEGAGGQQGNNKEGEKISLRYLLPSYSAAEAAGMIGRSRVTLPPRLEWAYAPPFPNNIFVPPKGSDEVRVARCLAWSIPALPDDPKTRFLDELVHDHLPRQAEDKSKRTTEVRKQDDDEKVDTEQGGSSEGGQGVALLDANVTEALDDVTPAHRSDKPRTTTRDRAQERKETDRRRAQTALSRVSVDEFWERMGFRQECSSGDVTGFFHLSLESPSTQGNVDHHRDSEPPSHLNETVSSSATPLPPSTALPIAIVDRIHQSLLNCDFGNKGDAIDGTRIWTKSTQAIVRDEIGERGWEAVTGVVVGKAGVTVDLTAVKRKQEATVTMLKPRKKARPAPVAPSAGASDSQ